MDQDNVRHAELQRLLQGYAAYVLPDDPDPDCDLTVYEDRDSAIRGRRVSIAKKSARDIARIAYDPS